MASTTCPADSCREYPQLHRAHCFLGPALVDVFLLAVGDCVRPVHLTSGDFNAASLDAAAGFAGTAGVSRIGLSASPTCCSTTVTVGWLAGSLSQAGRGWEGYALCPFIFHSVLEHHLVHRYLSILTRPPSSSPFFLLPSLPFLSPSRMPSTKHFIP